MRYETAESDPFLKTRLGQAIVAIGSILIVVAVFVGEWQYRKSEVYDGVVVEKDRRTRWDHIFDVTARDSERYRHYLVFQTTDGDRLRRRVTFRTFAQAEIGDPIEKARGEYYPKLMTEEAIRNRKASQEVLGRLMDQFRNQEQQE